MQQLLENYMPISGAVDICLRKRLNFAVYRIPGEAVTMIWQKTGDCILDRKDTGLLPAKGFLIAPFSRENSASFLIRPDMVISGTLNAKQSEEISHIPENQLLQSSEKVPEDTARSDYMDLISRSISKIKAGVFEKVVLSRVKSVNGNFTTRLPEIFDSLCLAYPHAFVYLFSVNGQCWTGASPEPFVVSRDNEIRTVSLAGTRTFSENNLQINNWNKKELQEQEYVTLHIEKILEDYHISGYKKEGPYAARAGNLVHLRTDFSFTFDEIKPRLPLLINTLHPTPAVCGMSAVKAMEYIMESEKHDREYYAGYLGPLGLSDRIRLYMNLRCMRVFNDRLVLYIGGGITQDSVPEEEWEETEIKADTLLSIINAIR